MNEVDSRRLAFGDQLRLLRESAEISGKRLAKQLGWQASKISRIENAKQAVSDPDIIALCDALGVNPDQKEELRNELRAIRVEEARWNRQLRVGHRAVQETVGKAEQAARRIRVFSLTLVPGLLQTAEYARHVFISLSEFHGSLPDADQAVQARMERQHVLYAEGKQIELLVAESALRSPIAPPGVMLAQIDRLMALQGLPSLRFGIVPLDSQLPAAVSHNFVMKDDVVTVELLNTEIVTREATDVQLYLSYFDALWERACEGEEARSVLRDVSDHYRDRLTHEIE